MSSCYLSLPWTADQARPTALALALAVALLLGLPASSVQKLPPCPRPHYPASWGLHTVIVSLPWEEGWDT